MASALLAERGPADGGFRLRSAPTARAVGISRTGLYRMWPTMDALADDLRRYGMVENPDWRRSLLEQEATGPLGDAVASASRVDPAFIALCCRTLAAATPGGDLHDLGTAADRWWLDAFGRWLADRLRAERRAPLAGFGPLDLAVVLTTLIEGTFTQAAMSAGRDRAFWTEREAAELARTLDRVWARLTVPGEPPSGPDGGPPPVPTVGPWTDRQRRALDAVFQRHVSLPFDHEDGPFTVRLLDLAALSRRVGITERRLHQLWPSVPELNADLFSHQVSRLRAETEALATQLLLEKLNEGQELSVAALVEVLQAVIGLGVERGSAGLFAIAAAVAEPVLSARAEQEFADWRASQQILVYGLVNAFGSPGGAEAPIGPSTHAVFATLMGSMRMALADPSVLDRRVGDGTVPLLGAGVSLVVDGLTRRLDAV